MSDDNSATNPMKFHVKGNLRDLLKFKNLVKVRQKKIAKASLKSLDPPYINDLAQQLHPLCQNLIIDAIHDESSTTKTFKLIPDIDSGTKQCAYFRAGQYLSLHVNIDGALITRPYSIASSPTDALNGFYELTIRKLAGGYFTKYIWDHWKVGQKIQTSEPLGFFYYESLRDSPTIVGIAGGSGITPFRSIIREIVAGRLNVKLNLIYGCSDENDIIYHDELKALVAQHPTKFKIIFVLSCDEVQMEGCELGFITAEILQKYTDPGKDSYFLCGPAIMYDFVITELEKLNVPQKQIRREAYGEIRNVVRFSSYPENIVDQTFKITIHKQNTTQIIPALAKESVLIALERAKLALPSACRSGECQFCRSLLLKGDIWVSPHSDGRRHADVKFGYFHPCASFPLSDLEMELPISKKC